mmetsp:Transcript_22224/g.31036  ORF Transcript_22224/g.31036 Transcript_22224/m.31036 type:complete len:550 (-) Transcript_22224:170-1819(-)|eukprot:CAMPEP_0184486866 /NCGR_PEP_ID=MMETSP0113_2-20130426/8757_1 /TAXON_ID=91329 /ORGANISM="Norrisiella sphaerica, Strain BC52" /LENGTH=549 /DNA_ID=CAMNT_0026868933 /DNA_START=41 /DNA_END=1690 /DNA_ORIENTATION=-
MTNSNNSPKKYDYVRYVLSLAFPPLGVYFTTGIGDPLLINFVLTCCFYFPGVIHALYVIENTNRQEKKQNAKPLYRMISQLDDDVEAKEKADRLHKIASEEVEKMRKDGRSYATDLKDRAGDKFDDARAYVEKVKSRMGDEWDEGYRGALESFQKQVDLSQSEFDKQKKEYQEQWNEKVVPIVKENLQKVRDITDSMMELIQERAEYAQNRTRELGHKYKSKAENVRGDDLGRLILSFIFPPASVYFTCGFSDQLFISFVLTFMFYFPGVCHALFVIGTTGDARKDKHGEAIRDFISTLKADEPLRKKMETLYNIAAGESTKVREKANNLYSIALDEVEQMRNKGEDYAKDSRGNKIPRGEAYIRNVKDRMGADWSDDFKHYLNEFQKQADLSQADFEKQREKFRKGWNEQIIPSLLQNWKNTKSWIFEQRDSVYNQVSDLYSVAMDEIDHMRNEGDSYVKKAQKESGKRLSEMDAYIQNMKKRMNDKWDDKYEDILKSFQKQVDLSQNEFEKRRGDFESMWNQKVTPIVQETMGAAEDGKREAEKKLE